MKKQDLNLELTPKLRYERISPADMKFTDAVPTWTQPADNIDESILALLDEEWHTDHIKAELLRLHFQPLDRSRQALGEQLVSEFVNPDRITTSLQSLSLFPASVTAFVAEVQIPLSAWGRNRYLRAV